MFASCLTAEYILAEQHPCYQMCIKTNVTVYAVVTCLFDHILYVPLKDKMRADIRCKKLYLRCFQGLCFIGI